MTAAFNAFMTGSIDVLLWPFGWAPPVVGLTVLSAAAGVVLLLLFKWTSPQQTIKRVKESLWGNLHEIRIFKDEIGVLSRAIGRLMRDNAFYLACCLVALVPLMAIVLPLMFQLDARYGFAPLKQGDVVVLDVRLANEVDPVATPMRLELPEGLSVDAGPVRVASSHEAVWRLRVEREGEHVLGIVVGDERHEKRVDASGDLATVSPARFKASSHLLDALMFPVERPLAESSQVEAISLSHARAGMLGISGDSYPWMWIFCLVSIVFGFALKGVFRVTI